MHSQNEEEKIILEYFQGKTGTFLDCGANDGMTFSNTRALAEIGWRGVFIEPSPKAFAKLKENYKGMGNKSQFYFYEVALSDHNGRGILQESGALCSAADVGLVSTFHQSEMDRFKRSVSYQPIEVKTFKWKTFYNRLVVKEFDFISIDCEGDELKFMPDMDFSKTSCVCVEWNSKPELKAEYDKILECFKVIYTSGENLIYVR